MVVRPPKTLEIGYAMAKVFNFGKSCGNKMLDGLFQRDADGFLVLFF